MAELAGGWQWSLRVTPFLGLMLLIVTAIFAVEPERGAVEREEREAAARDNEAAASSSRPADNANALNDTGPSSGDAVERAPLTEKSATGGSAEPQPLATAAEPAAQSKLNLWLADIVMLIKTCVTSGPNI